MARYRQSCKDRIVARLLPNLLWSGRHLPRHRARLHVRGGRYVRTRQAHCRPAVNRTSPALVLTSNQESKSGIQSIWPGMPNENRVKALRQAGRADCSLGAPTIRVCYLREIFVRWGDSHGSGTPPRYSLVHGYGWIHDLCRKVGRGSHICARSEAHQPNGQCGPRAGGRHSESYR